MDDPPVTSTKKAPDVHVLRCLNPACRALLAYEVDSHNVLHIDLAWTARREGDLAYFPCPKCSGKNIVEPFTDDRGRRRHRVTHWKA
jgi:hypothetical protein